MPDSPVPLREYIERIFDEREKALQLAFRAQQEALALATTSLNRELEHLNNLRQEYSGDRGRLLGFAAGIGALAGLVAAVLGQKVGL